MVKSCRQARVFGLLVAFSVHLDAVLLHFGLLRRKQVSHVLFEQAKMSPELQSAVAAQMGLDRQESLLNCG